MTIKKVLNDGRHLTQSNSIITFSTSKGNRTPKYIYVGFSNSGIELYDITKKGCMSKIERDNRLFIVWTGRKWG